VKGRRKLITEVRDWIIYARTAEVMILKGYILLGL